MRSWIPKIIIALLFISGLAIMLYPFISDQVARFQASQVINEYDAAVSSIASYDKEDMIAKAKAYNEKLAKTPSMNLSEGASVQALMNEDGEGMASESTFAEYEEYLSLLNPSGSGMMGYVSIPEIQVELPVYHGTSEIVLQSYAGHMVGSSLPVGGDNTHSVIAGHSGLQSAELFTHLDYLEEGSYFALTILGDTRWYRVDSMDVVLPNEIEYLKIEEGRDLVTLLTCTPYGVNSHRLLVTGVATDIVPDEILADFPIEYNFWLWIIIISGLLIVLIVIFIILILRYRRRKEDEENEEDKEENVAGDGVEESTDKSSDNIEISKEDKDNESDIVSDEEISDDDLELIDGEGGVLYIEGDGEDPPKIIV